MMTTKQNDPFPLSHEFRSLLYMFLGSSLEIESLEVSDQIVSKITLIKQSANNLLVLIDHLSRLETFQINVLTQKSIQDFKTKIQTMTDSFVVLAKSKNIQLIVEDIDSVFFDFTPDALESLILNLLSDAVKYSSAGQTVRINARRNANQQYIVTVKNIGSGIPIGSPQKTKKGNSKLLTGASIGFAHVKEIVEVHKGYITIDSDYKNNTTIVIHLPIVSEFDAHSRTYKDIKESVELELIKLSENFVAVFSDEYLTNLFNVEELKTRLLDYYFTLIQSTATVYPEYILGNPKNQTQKIEEDSVFLTRLDNVLNKIYEDSELKIESIATVFCISQRQLLRILQSAIGMTPVDYLRRFRLAKAKILLAEGASISNAAFDVGFSSHSYFSKSFKIQYGCTPSEFLKISNNN